MLLLLLKTQPDFPLLNGTNFGVFTDAPRSGLAVAHVGYLHACPVGALNHNCAQNLVFRGESPYPTSSGADDETQKHPLQPRAGVVDFQRTVLWLSPTLPASAASAPSAVPSTFLLADAGVVDESLRVTRAELVTKSC